MSDGKWGVQTPPYLFFSFFEIRDRSLLKITKQFTSIPYSAIAKIGERLPTLENRKTQSSQKLKKKIATR